MCGIRSFGDIELTHLRQAQFICILDPNIARLFIIKGLGNGRRRFHGIVHADYDLLGALSINGFKG